jgi:hypothetical protein
MRIAVSATVRAAGIGVMREMADQFSVPPDVATNGAAGLSTHGGERLSVMGRLFWIVPVQSGAGASNGCHQRRASFGRHGPSIGCFSRRRHKSPFAYRGWAHGRSVPMGRMTRRTIMSGKGPQRNGTARLTVSLPNRLLSRLRDAVYWMPHLTLARLVESALQSAVQRLEEEHGGPFPRRLRELKPGRPRMIPLCEHAAGSRAGRLTSVQPVSGQSMAQGPVRHATPGSLSPSLPSQGLPESSK